MIIANGTIEFKSKAEGGIDPETGYPLKPSSEEWGEPVPCQFKAVRFNQLAKVNEEPVISSSFEVLIEEQDVPSEIVRLTDAKGKPVGEFSIMRIEPIEAVCEVRILI